MGRPPSIHPFPPLSLSDFRRRRIGGRADDALNPIREFRFNFRVVEGENREARVGVIIVSLGSFLMLLKDGMS